MPPNSNKSARPMRRMLGGPGNSPLKAGETGWMYGNCHGLPDTFRPLGGFGPRRFFLIDTCTWEIN